MVEERAERSVLVEGRRQAVVNGLRLALAALPGVRVLPSRQREGGDPHIVVVDTGGLEPSAAQALLSLTGARRRRSRLIAIIDPEAHRDAPPGFPGIDFVPAEAPAESLVALILGAAAHEPLGAVEAGPPDDAPEPAHDAPEPMVCLTPRERQVAEAAATGLSDDGVAGMLQISPVTVRSHLKHAADKIGLRSRAELLELVGRSTNGAPPYERPGFAARARFTVWLLMAPSIRSAALEATLSQMASVGSCAAVAEPASLTAGDRPGAVIVVDANDPELARAAARAGEMAVVAYGPPDTKLIRELLEAGITAYASDLAPIDALERTLASAAVGTMSLPDDAVRPLIRGLLSERGEQDAALRALLRLSRREREVLRLLVQGHTDAGLARELVVSRNTVRSHVRQILSKLEVNSRREASELVRRHRLHQRFLDDQPG